MKSVRDIITEACARINLVPRRQAIPGDILENAYRLLKGVVSKYNNDNLLSWTMNNVVVNGNDTIHLYDEHDTVGANKVYFNDVEDMRADPASDYDAGTLAYLKESPSNIHVYIAAVVAAHGAKAWLPVKEGKKAQDTIAWGTMEHVYINSVAKLNSVYVVTPEGFKYDELYKLDFVPYSDFDKYSSASRVYTYIEKSEHEWLIYVKPYFSDKNKYRIKINYNEGIEFDLDSDLYIPDAYVELLIVATAHKLAIQYPRLDEAHMNRLEKEVQVLVDNVRTPKAADRVLTRDYYWDDIGTCSQERLLRGW